MRKKREDFFICNAIVSSLEKRMVEFGEEKLLGAFRREGDRGSLLQHEE